MNITERIAATLRDHRVIDPLPTATGSYELTEEDITALAEVLTTELDLTEQYCPFCPHCDPLGEPA